MARRALLTLLLIVLAVPALCVGCDNAEPTPGLTEEQVLPIIVAPADNTSSPVTPAATAIALPATNETVVAPSPGLSEAVPAQPVATTYDTALYGNLDALDLRGVELSFLHMHYDWRGEALQQIVEDFNAGNPYGIRVTEVVPGSYPEVQQAMSEAIETGTLPGLVSAYQHWVTDYLTRDALVALDPYITHPVHGLSAEDLADFYPAFLAADRLPQYGMQAYGFPYRRSQGVLYYNANWLTELYDSGAISFQGPPRTPEQFAEAACAATAKPGAVGYEIATEASRIAAWTFAFGGDVYDHEAGRFTWDNPATIAALEMMQDLYQRGCVKKITEHQGELFDFSGQLALFVYGSSAYMPIYQQAVDEDPAGGFNWSVAPIPYVGDQPVQNSFGPSLSIPRTDPETQLAAWLFIKYLTRPEVQAQWVAGSDYYPVRAGAYDYLDDYIAAHPAFADGFALLPYSTFEPPIAGYDRVHDYAAEAYFRILAGEDVATVLAQLNELANATLLEFAPQRH